jgi:beta-glucosidase
LSPDMEGEEGAARSSEATGDKLHLGLPGLQQQLLEAVVAVGKPVIVVLVSGSPLAVTWADQHASAILQAFYPGEETGSALGDVLFGDVSPAGRLPVTFPRSLDDVPPFEDYAMRGRTYRFLEAEPLYPFGFGLSYTRFEYSGLALHRSKLELSETLAVMASVTVSNAGNRASDEVVQLYVRSPPGSSLPPRHELCGVKRIHLAAGDSATVFFELNAKALSSIDDAGQRQLLPGIHEIFVGGCQPDARSAALLDAAPLMTMLELTGAPLPLPY